MNNEGIRRVKIFDTTLRDGEQSPGCSMNLQEKLEVARGLELLGVDILEAGFPISSPGDREAVKAIAGIVKNSTVAGLCRCLEKDIDAGWEALSAAADPRLHLFLATSPLHMEYKLKLKPEEVLEQTAASVRYARKFCSNIQFSAEDASRSDRDFLCRVFGEAIKAGALTINIPDTVGYAMSEEFGALVRYVKEHTPGIEKAVLAVHVHNDLGLAVANSLAAVAAGAEQVECTVNGIGERAGNASLEEIVMALKVRRDYWQVDTRINTAHIYAASRLVSQVTGVKVHPHKAIVGDNAFAHESGVHQHGVLANRATYEIMSPESIGIPQSPMVLGKHSGRRALEERIRELGITLTGEALDGVFAEFKALADKKKGVGDRDIEALALGAAVQAPARWQLAAWKVDCGSDCPSRAAITLRRRDGSCCEETAQGDGPIDAAIQAINRIIGEEILLESYEQGAVTAGTDAQGQTTVKIRWQGRTWSGRGVSTNVIEATIKAYLAAWGGAQTRSV